MPKGADRASATCQGAPHARSPTRRGPRFRWINVAELDSVETWQAIISGPEFGAIAARMAEFHPSPGLYAVEVGQTAEAAR